MNAQQKAIALFLQLVVAGPKRRKELLKEQHSFVAVIRHEERIVSHGEFFMEGHPPLRGVVQTCGGLAIEDVEGGAAFVPLYPSASFAPAAVLAAPAPVAPAAVPAPVPVVPVPAPARLLVTRSRRVTFGEEVTCHNGTFTSTLVVIAPSSGAIIEERFSDGQVIVTFVGASRQTWTII